MGKYWCCECGGFNIHSRKEAKCEICDAVEKKSPDADKKQTQYLEDASVELYWALVKADESLTQNEIYEDNPKLNLLISKALLRAKGEYFD